MREALHCFIFLKQIKFRVTSILTKDVKSAVISYHEEAGEEVLSGMGYAALITWGKTLVCVLSSSKAVTSSEGQQPTHFMGILDEGNFHHDSFTLLLM